jgi:lysozyme
MNVNNLTYSPNGFKLTEQFEGLQLKAYQDIAGIWTNGYGNTHNVVPGSTITMEQAVSDLASNIEGAEFVVNRVVTVPLTQNQFDALVDFVFNLGSGNFQSSTLLRLLNQKNYVGASQEFPKWNHSGGHIVEGLTRRRLAEQALFNS